MCKSLDEELLEENEEDRVFALKEWNPAVREDHRDKTDNEES